MPAHRQALSSSASQILPTRLASENRSRAQALSGPGPCSPSSELGTGPGLCRANTLLAILRPSKASRCCSSASAQQHFLQRFSLQLIKVWKITFIKP